MPHDEPATTTPERAAPSGSTDSITRPHQPPAGARTTFAWLGGGDAPMDVTATAGWTVLRREESPAAEVFTVAYTLDGSPPADRPVTFVFNGGPGASAAYLHVGALGPRRLALPDDGSVPPSPTRLVDNTASWLPWTDLVFIDPVGTGFSRRLPTSTADRASGQTAEPGGTGVPPQGGGSAAGTGVGNRAASEPPYLTFGGDLAAMREVISRWLSANDRWASPVWLAGESYGGYRIGRLARSLPVEEGVGLAGVVAISPALELLQLSATDYAIEAFVDTVPTMAAAARHHGRIRGGLEGASVDEVMDQAAAFATGDYVTFLAQGAAMPADRRAEVLARLADLTGLDVGFVERLHGRIPLERFARELLRDEGRVLGRYDATQVLADPFPDREPVDAPDHTLDALTPAFTAAVNQVLRTEIGVRTERRYHVLSMDVNAAWRGDEDQDALLAPPGAVDDLRYGLAVNPHLQVLIVHGRHDLVTPPHTSRRLVDAMRLDPQAAERVRLRTYDGGHMFYVLAASLTAFADDVRALYAGVAHDAG